MKRLLCLISILGLTNLLQASSENAISLEAEFGAGHLITFSSEYKQKKLGFGLSLGFDTAKYEYLDYTSHEYLYNFSGLASYNILSIKDMDIDGYARVGYELYSLSSYDSSTFFFAPGVKVGYKFVFVDFAFPTVWGLDNPLYVFQLGGGLRYSFPLKK